MSFSHTGYHDFRYRIHLKQVLNNNYLIKLIRVIKWLIKLILLFEGIGGI